MNDAESWGLALGAVGTVLGVISTTRLFLDDRVVLLVRAIPRVVVQVGGSATRDVFAFSVVNLGRFAVTLSMVGLTTGRPHSEFLVLNPEIPDGGAYPRRLEPRDGFTVFISQEGKREQFLSVRRPYATTLCGAKCLGPRSDGRALRRWATQASA